MGKGICGEKYPVTVMDSVKAQVKMKQRRMHVVAMSSQFLSAISYVRYTEVLLFISNIFIALTGVAQWTECRPSNQSVTGLIPNQGTCLGCGPGPQ